MPLRQESKSEVRATPRSGALGAIADATKALHDNYLKAQFGYENPVTDAVSKLVGIPAFAEMMDRMSYGESPFQGKGQTLKVKDWAVDGLMSLPAGVAADAGLRAIKSLPGALKHASKEFAHATAGAAPRVIKPKGAQTVTRKAEEELWELTRRPMNQDPEERLRLIEEAHANLAQTAPGTVTPQYTEALERERRRMINDAALNKWIEGPLRKYVTRDMGTPDDPVRKLADENIVHADFGDAFAQPSAYLRSERVKSGFPAEGVATTPQGKRYETQADYAAGEAMPSGDPYTEEMLFIGDIPDWYKKLPDETMIYEPSIGGMQFDHIIDVLAEDLAAGRIRPEQLSKVSMSDAVRRTHQYNIDKAAAMEKAAVEETGKYFPVHREYPSGFKWVNLKAKPAQKPDDLAEKARQKYEKYLSAGYDEAGALERANKHHIEELTEKALKSEGEIMGHCVGGYCDSVLNDETQIYSLRDPKGRSHVTVEVSNPEPSEFYDVAEDALRMERGGNYTGDDVWERAEQIAVAQSSQGGRIQQIKGKQNLAPVADYQPYVADFVRSGQWNPNIGDFSYTDLVKIGDKYLRKPELEQLMKEQEYARTVDPKMALEWFQRADRMDPSTLMDADQKMLEAIKNFTPPEMAKGGPVDFGKLLTEAVKKYSPMKMAQGGLVDALRAAYFGG